MASGQTEPLGPFFFTAAGRNSIGQSNGFSANFEVTWSDIKDYLAKNFETLRRNLEVRIGRDKENGQVLVFVGKILSPGEEFVSLVAEEKARTLFPDEYRRILSDDCDDVVIVFQNRR